MSLEPGRAVGESLRLVRLLGRGAMGSVWLADHLGLQSQVAVKFIAQAMAEDPVAVRRFQQEAKAAAEIRSPHVVRVFDHGMTDEGPYIVMELLEGESLEKRVKSFGPLAVPELVKVVTQACKALARAHERGIIHRDIKPGNIFLVRDDDLFVKVLDFGVAKFSGQEAIDMTAQGNMVGTPAYMSPEQLFHGKSIDHRGDLWSLAVVAYQALTGERPFDGVTLGELCVAIKRGEFTPPSKLRTDVPPEVDAWFAKAFARQLDDRFKTAKEMALALEHAIGLSSTMTSVPSLVASPVLATYSGTATSMAPRQDRRRWIAAAAIAALLGVFALGWLLLRATPAAPAKVASPGPRAAAQAAPSAPEPVATAVAAPDAAPEAASGARSSAPAARPATASHRAPAPPASKKTAPAATADAAQPPADERDKRAGEQLGI